MNKKELNKISVKRLIISIVIGVLSCIYLAMCLGYVSENKHLVVLSMFVVVFVFAFSIRWALNPTNKSEGGY